MQTKASGADVAIAVRVSPAARGEMRSFWARLRVARTSISPEARRIASPPRKMRDASAIVSLGGLGWRGQVPLPLRGVKGGLPPLKKQGGRKPAYARGWGGEKSFYERAKRSE